MSNEPIEEDTPPEKLKQRFGEDADLYAEVRAEAAAAAGRSEASQKWDETAKAIEDSEKPERPGE